MLGHAVCARTTLQDQNCLPKHTRGHTICVLPTLLHSFLMSDNQMGIKWNLTVICIP